MSSDYCDSPFCANQEPHEHVPPGAAATIAALSRTLADLNDGAVEQDREIATLQREVEELRAKEPWALCTAHAKAGLDGGCSSCRVEEIEALRARIAELEREKAEHREEADVTYDRYRAVVQRAEAAEAEVEQLSEDVDEHLPHYVLEDGTGDEASARERIEYAGREIDEHAAEVATAEQRCAELEAALRKIGYWRQHGEEVPTHGDYCHEGEKRDDSCGCNGSIARAALDKKGR